MQGRCVILGGGLAGLAAALHLAERGHPVSLFEAGPVFGGRAGSWVDPQGNYADAGLHVVAGHYRHLLGIVDSLGVSDALEWSTRHPWYGGGERLWFGFSPLPVPFHLWPLREIRVSWSQRARLARAAARVAFSSQQSINALDHITYEEWQNREGLSDPFVRELGAFASDATTFLDPSQVSARAVLSWLRNSFASAHAARIGVWRRPIGQSFIEPLVCRIRQLGGVLRTDAAAVNVCFDSSRARAVEIRPARLSTPCFDSRGRIETADPSEEIPCDVLISALPFQCLRQTFGNAALGRAGLDAIAGLSPTPALSALLEFDRPVMPHAAPALVSGRSLRDVFPIPPSWPGFEQRHAVQLLLSDARARWGDSDAQLIAQAVDDLAALESAARKASVLSARVQRIDAAMFAAVPGAHALRASTRTSISNLFIAGDWTGHPYNASMEGAVFSGIQAASAACELLQSERRSHGSGS